MAHKDIPQLAMGSFIKKFEQTQDKYRTKRQQTDNKPKTNIRQSQDKYRTKRFYGKKRPFAEILHILIQCYGTRGQPPFRWHNLLKPSIN